MLFLLHIVLWYFHRTLGAVSVRGSYSARMPRSSFSRVHWEFVHHIAEEKLMARRKDRTVGEKIDSKERKVEKSKRTNTQHERMEMTHGM